MGDILSRLNKSYSDERSFDDKDRENKDNETTDINQTIAQPTPGHGTKIFSCGHSISCRCPDSKYKTNINHPCDSCKK